MKRYALGILLAFMVLASTGSAIDYPKAVEGKYLYDTAGILNAQEYKDLNAKLVAYQERTTAEVAVVTTQSLQGQSLDGYARGLFNFWGVGRADVNNGVLILLSLDENDRGVWIQPGDGVAGYIDGDSIAQDDMIPYFRNQRWYDGLAAGAEAVMQSLPSSWPAAAAASTQAPSNVPVSGGQSETGSGDWSGMLYLIAIVIGAVIALLIIRSALSARSKAQRAAEEKAQEERNFKLNNAGLIKGFKEQLASLEAALVPAQKSLNKLEENYPESLWGPLAKFFSGITADELKTVGLEIDVAEADAEENKEPQKISDTLAALGQKLASYARVCDDISRLLKKADQAKSEAQSALAHLSERIAEAQKKLEDKDVTDKARGLLGPAIERFPEVKAAYEGKDPRGVDWIQANAELREITANVSAALAQAREDKDLAERARTEGPKMLARIGEVQRELDEKAERYRDSRSAQAEIAAAREKITEVQQSSSRDGSTDWMQTYLLLNAINSHNNEADRAHHAHVQRIEQERKDTLAAEARRQRQAEEARHRSSSQPFGGGHSSSISHSSSSFGGGHSGGRGGGGRF